MRATGIIRRIDDLGRIVIPKEIRRTMRIREGDPLEIFTDLREGIVCFKKYSPLGDMENIVYTAEKLLIKYGVNAAIYDRDNKITGGKIFPNEASPAWAYTLDDWAFEDERGACFKVHNIYVNGEVYGFIVYIDTKQEAKEGIIAAKRLIATVLEED